MIQSTASFDEGKQRELMRRLESIISEKEPLIISIISTVYEVVTYTEFQIEDNKRVMKTK